MTDFLSCFADNHFYSNTLANWSSIEEGSKIELMGRKEQYTVTKNDIVSWYKDFNVLDKNTIEIISPDKGIVVDGDNIDVYFEIFGVSLIVNVENGGTGYRVNDILELHENTVHDHEYGGKDYAELRVTEVSNGAVVTVEVEYDGKFIKHFDSAPVKGGSGTGCVVQPIFHTHEKKLHKLLTAIDSQYLGDRTKVILFESLKDNFTTGEIITKRHRLTVNIPCSSKVEHYPFIVLVKETPYLNLPLANNENVAQLYNQAILTIDKKLQDLS
jgi:hypothetical protein